MSANSGGAAGNVPPTSAPAITATQSSAPLPGSLPATAVLATAPTTVAQPARTGFLDLPFELHTWIYEMVLKDEKDIILKPAASRAVISDRPHSLVPRILHLCKQIHDEATPILYGGNPFAMAAKYLRPFLNQIGESAQYLRHITVKFNGSRDSIRRGIHLMKRIPGIRNFHLEMVTYGELTNSAALVQLLSDWAKSIKRSRQEGRAGSSGQSVPDLISITAGKKTSEAKQEAADTEAKEYEDRVKVGLTGVLR